MSAAATMWLRPDQQKVHKMLTEAIMMLCRNGLEYSQGFSVEGLLGITLDSKEVFLVNIKEKIQSSSGEKEAEPSKSGPGIEGDTHTGGNNTNSRANDSTPQQPQQASTPYASPSGCSLDGCHFPGPHHNHHDHHSPHAGAGMMPCPVSPLIYPFKSPFRRQRGRRRFLMGLEARGMRRKFPGPHQRMMSVMMAAHQQMSQGHMDAFGMSMAKRQHTEATSSRDDTPSHTTTLASTNADTNSNQTTEPKVKVEPVASYGDEDNDGLQIDEGASLEYRRTIQDSDVMDTFDGSTGNISPWKYQEENNLQPATPSSVDTLDNMSETYEFEDLIGDVDPSLVNKVKAAILKEDGCFVTTRMLCRRYSAFFKSHLVIEAMKKITVPTGNPQHIGMFCDLKERSKLFYKCPPHQINPETLKPFNISTEEYLQSYYKMPKPKGMHMPRWDVFFRFVLQNCPYGAMNARDFKMVEDHDDTEPGNSLDEFALQQNIVFSEGCFISSRILCRRLTKAYRVNNAIRAMKAMSRKRDDKHYIGEFIKVSERIKIFYKCPPRLLGSEALTLYGLTLEQYKNIYVSSPRPYDGSVTNWDSYVENVASQYPYPFEDFPLMSCDISPDVVDRIQGVMGATSSANYAHQMASLAGSMNPSQSQESSARVGTSTATLDRIRSMLQAGQSGESLAGMSGIVSEQDGTSPSTSTEIH